MSKILICIHMVLFVNPAFPQDTKENADFKLAVNLYNDKLYDLALEQFRQFINLYPNTQNGIEARFYLGLSQTKLGKHEDARITFQNFALAYADHPKAPDAWWNVGEAFVAMNNPREAALAFERVKTFHPKSKQAPSGLSKAAEYFEIAKDRENAKKVLRSLTQDYASADILPYRLKLAGFLMEEGEFEQARVECKSVADATKDGNLKSRALVLMGRNLVNLGRIVEAESALNQVITSLRNSSSYYESLLALGRLKRSAGNVGESLAAWRVVSDDSLRAPGSARQEALVELGDASMANREFTKALDYYRRGVALKGSRGAEASFKAGAVAERLNNIGLAAEFYARAYSDTAGTFDRRAILFGAFKSARTSKNYIEATKIAQMYQKDYSSDSQTARLLLECAELYQFQLNDPRRAIDWYEGVLTRFPGAQHVDAAHFGLGTALRQAGEYERAIQQLETLPKKYPSSEYVQKAQEEADRIRIFDLKDRETGQEKLALLIGDVIEQKSKGDLAFRLAEIYFHHLKDYANAATQFRSALDSDLADARQASAWFYMATSYEYLALKQNGKQYQRNAIATYDSLLRRFPASEFSERAQVSQFNLKLQLATTATDVRKLGTDFLSRFPDARRKDLALLALGNSYHQSKNFGDAALTYKLMLEKHPLSEAAPEALFQLGTTLFEMGDRDSSAVILNAFVTANSNHQHTAQAIHVLATIASEQGKAAEAIKWYDRLEKAYFYSNFNNELDAQRGNACYNAGNHMDAVEYYIRYLQALKDDISRIADAGAEILHRLAVSYDKLGKHPEAKKYYAEYLLREPSSERSGAVYYALATIARNENRLDLATKYLQEAGRFGSSHQSDLVALETAELLFGNEQYAEALTRLSDVAGRTKNDSIQQYLQSRIIICYFRLDNIKEADKRATAFVKSFLTAGRYSAEFEFERGKYHFRRDELDRAVQRFALVRAQYPTSAIVPEAMYWTGRAYELKEQPQFAVQLYDSILKHSPTSNVVPRTHLSLGNVYYNQERWDDAAKLYKAILDNPERSPDLVQFAMNNLILTYKELNLFDAALDLTRKYIANYPGEPDLIDKRIDIGVLYQKLGYYDQSIVHLNSLLEGGNAEIEPEVRYYVGEAYFYKAEYQQAILEFLKVPYLVARRGNIDWTATSYYMAGQSYEKMSKYDQAVTMYRQIIERPGIDVAFKTAAQKEIDRVRSIERRN